MSTTLQQPQAKFFSTDKSNIDLRIDKKEFDIFTEDCTCIIDEVEFVKIIDLKTNMSLPVLGTPQAFTSSTPRKGIHKFVSRMFNRLVILPLTLPLCLVLVLGMGNVWGQAYFNMSSGNYSQNFNGITTLPTNFSTVAVLSTGSIPITTKTTTASTSSLSVVGTGAAIGRDVTTSTRLAFLTTGATDNTTAIATDLNLNFTSRNAGNLSFDASTIFNSIGNRVSSLRVYYSIDGSTWSELTGTNLPYSATNNVAGSASVSITLPSAINNQATVVLRFYYHNGSGGSTGSRPKIGIDNLLVTSTAASTAPTISTPTVSSITTTSATLGATVSSNGGAALTSRGTVWGTSASPTGNVLAEGGTTVDAYTHSRTGLIANTAYTYRGYGTNSAGTGYSADGTFTTLPLEPTVGTGNSISSSGFTANWSHPTMGSVSYTYTIDVDDDISFGSINSTVTSIASSNTSQAIAGLAASTTYYYRVKAVNAQGSSGWSSTSAGVTTSTAATPTLNAVTLLSTLSTTYGTASTVASFTASGSNLTGNISATAQIGYEVSSDNLNFGSSVSVTSGTTVYVRFASTRAAGTYNSATAVVLSGGGASSSANVTTSLSGNTVSKATPSISSTPTATTITYGQTLTSSILSGGSASVAGSFAFTTPSIVPNGGTANQSITFTPTDSANYNTTTTIASVTVNKSNQTISFGALTNKTTTDPAFSLTATASSGLTVSYSSSNTSVATVAGSTVTIVGSGQTTITASQAGDGNYNAATSVDQPLTVTQAPVNIFTENMSSSAATTAITSHTFQNSSTFTFTNGGATNSADVRNTSTSSGYTGASGNGNIFFTSTAGNYGFAIEGIDASTYTNLEVRFAYRKESGSVLPNLTIDYWNGSSYVNVPFSYNEAANAAAGWYLVNWIALPAGAQISTLSLRWVKAGSQSVRLDDISLRGIINTSPLILVSPNSITGFSQNSSTPSSEQSYTVSGDNLTNDVTITPPAGYEISTSTGGSFSATNPITLSASGGNLVGEPVTIYVRQSASTLGVISGNITHSSTGANSPNVAVSGTRTGSYYSKATGNLDDINSWGSNTDGSGSTPSNFSTDGIIYEIRNRTTATIGANWTVTGTASKVLVGDGTNSTDFTIPSGFVLTGTVDVNNVAELSLENTTAPTFGTFATNSTLEYKDLPITLSSSTTYKNLKLTGSGTKTFPGNTTTITGNLILTNTTIDGGSGPFSTISLSGDLTYVGTVTPPADANSITLSTNGNAGGTQTITGAGNTLRWFRIQSTTANTILLSTSGGSSNLLLGNSSGGGITLVDGSILDMNGNDITLFSSVGTSSAFLLNSTASISTTSATDLTIERTGNGNLGTLRFTSGSNTIGNLTLKHIGSTNNLLTLGSALAINGSLTLTNGVLSVGANTLSLNGSINRTSGFVDASNAAATIVFGGSSSQNIPASTFSGNIANLTLNNVSGLSTSQNLTILSGLSLTSGTLTVGANTLTLNGSINQTTGNIDASNATSTVVFGGSSAQSIPVSTFTGNINNLTLNNSAGLSISQNLSVVGALTLTSGTLTLGTNHLTLGENATTSGTFSSTNMIIATGLGELRKRIAQGSGDIASFTFPVGNIGGVAEYTPIVLDFESGNFGANAYVSVRVQDSKQATLNSSVTNYLNRNWIVEPNDITGFSYKIQLHYVDADFITDGSMAEGDLLPIKISSGQWYQPTDGSFTNAVSQGSAGIFASSNYLEWNGLTTFSEFGGAGGSSQPLPVELLSFTTECSNETIILKWQTASEFNSAYFEIQKSVDGSIWNTIGSEVAAGNSTELLNYTFEDASKTGNTSYYRLNQVDNDGIQKFYGPISPLCESIIHLNGKTIPNPSNNEFWLQISSAEQQKFSYILQDVNGTKIMENKAELLPGSNLFPIRETIPSGMYFIVVQTENGQQQVIKHIRN